MIKKVFLITSIAAASMIALSAAHVEPVMNEASMSAAYKARSIHLKKILRLNYSILLP